MTSLVLVNGLFDVQILHKQFRCGVFLFSQLAALASDC